MPGIVGISVTVDADHVEGIDVVGVALAEEGMRIDAVHRTIGIISGSVPASRLTALEAVPGILAIELEQHVDIRRGGPEPG
ncbi:hypothetical protein [Rhodococcus opacus]|uniref:hypothetical protein n=1 Tax=Rhodococcus opacus TaxID=37919 RepID=UPI001224E653|nr:hypothetical protein [Rhodococcus opacus]MDH6287877.1 hypothetical protein [Rhodococcus opacus]RZL70438.1 MAG: hypothetical protein EOP32_41515 [Rhodococcus sp. (in: high G+C Gram-positive bacteria)]